MMDRVTSFGFIMIPVATLPLVADDSLIHNGYSIRIKEGCNRGVACSLLKLGSLEKTVIASLLIFSLIFL